MKGKTPGTYVDAITSLTTILENINENLSISS